MNEKIEVLFSEQQITDRIKEVAKEISEFYNGETVTVVGILKGAVMAMTELVKRLEMPVEFDFMDVSSYGNDTVSSGKLEVKKDLEYSIEGKNVLVVEDIADTGRTLNYLFKYLNEQNPKSLKLFALLDKPGRREFEINVNWKGFDIPNEFIVGFGLDYAQRYRNLPYIGILSFDRENEE
jgi:hypoxanthine phosphoribosyltransferase